MRVGYGKLGRSMPLTLERCGNLGGDVEMVAVVKELALRHPDDEFVLVGRNDLSRPEDVGLPPNVTNPWIDWAPELRGRLNAAGITHGNLTIEDQRTCNLVFDGLTTDTFLGLDAVVMWVGQHGTTNMPLPSVQRPGEYTKPHDWSAYYCAYVLRGINDWRDVDPWRREEVWINADPRNRHKMRDLKWPLRHPVLTQFEFTNNLKHERFGDPTGFEEWSATYDVGGECYPACPGGGAIYDHFGEIWRSQVHNVYSRLEVNGLAPGTPFGDLISYDDDWDRPGHFGLFINEARAVGIAPARARVTVFRDWITPLDPHFVCGTWSETSQTALGRRITPAPWSEYYPRLHSVRCTFTTPSSGSGWATAKPWEAFAAGTVCFFHPAYDTQNNILGDAPSELREWLRVTEPEVLWKRVLWLNQPENRSDWEWLVKAQRAHFDAAMTEKRYLRLIEQRVWNEDESCGS